MLTVTPKKSGESAKEYALRVLLENIVSVNLAPGDKIVEHDICSALGLSRTPCREAELELARRKLITIQPKRGTFVSYIDPALVEEVRALRSVLEKEVSRLACKRLTASHVDSLWENMTIWEMYIRRGDEKKIFSLDKKFHKMLYAGCGCNYWYELIESVAPHFDRTTVLSFKCRLTEHVERDHIDLLKAIERGDEEEAVAVTARHMDRYIQNAATIRSAFPDYFLK